MKTAFEVLKFAVRLGLLIGTPLLISYAGNLTGTAHLIVGQVLPVLLPIVDKWCHEDPRIPVSGLISF